MQVVQCTQTYLDANLHHGRPHMLALSWPHTALGMIVIINCSGDKINNHPPVLPATRPPSSSPLVLLQDVGSSPYAGRLFACGWVEAWAAGLDCVAMALWPQHLGEHRRVC